jgi:DNA-binding CsgD family transcriptional regulator
MDRVLFESASTALSAKCLKVSRRHEGVAFLKTARDLYEIESISYLCINIPSTKPRGIFSHCAYSDTEVLNCLSHFPLERDIVDACSKPATDSGLAGKVLQLPLRKHCGESAVFDISLGADFDEERLHSIKGELRILANYFHSHVLRINGQDVDRSVLMSAKELDCLKWTAVGKTAWEASVILGITERTVRFHLNAAREKLKCTTTTQAVAKAIVHQLINIEGGEASKEGLHGRSYL